MKQKEYLKEIDLIKSRLTENQVAKLNVLFGEWLSENSDSIKKDFKNKHKLLSFLSNKVLGIICIVLFSFLFGFFDFFYDLFLNGSDPIFYNQNLTLVIYLCVAVLPSLIFIISLIIFNKKMTNNIYAVALAKYNELSNSDKINEDYLDEKLESNNIKQEKIEINGNRVEDKIKLVLANHKEILFYETFSLILLFVCVVLYFVPIFNLKNGLLVSNWVSITNGKIEETIKIWKPGDKISLFQFWIISLINFNMIESNPDLFSIIVFVSGLLILKTFLINILDGIYFIIRKRNSKLEKLLYQNKDNFNLIKCNNKGYKARLVVIEFFDTILKILAFAPIFIFIYKVIIPICPVNIFLQALIIAIMLIVHIIMRFKMIKARTNDLSLYDPLA